MSKDLWTETLDTIRSKVTSQVFATWFRPTRLLSREPGSLNIGVPNGLFAQWLETNYLSLIHEAIRENTGRSWEVLFVAPGERGTDSPMGAFASATFPAAAAPAADSQLNARYTFETFVVGDANEFAHAAALAVAEKPSHAYNPLYIYGGTGLGKTHLMHAIGNRIARSGRTLRMKYITTEVFVNELINSIRLNTTHAFKERYRNIDMLLIDDIQFLAGKERTQEEFFHTFNALYEGRHQIVMTSDCAPRDIPKLEERLRSRFEWGLLTDIQPPDLETKIAILNKKSGAVGVELPSDVALFIASKIKTNVRELEGALTRVIAYSALHSRPITLDLTKETLKDILTVEPPIITIESIQKVIADYHDLKVSELKSKNNAKDISFPRQIAMYLCKALTDKSLPEIGRRFGGKHHSTVIHAIRKIEDKRAREHDFDRLIHTFSEMFQ